MVLKEGILILQ